MDAQRVHARRAEFLGRSVELAVGAGRHGDQPFGAVRVSADGAVRAALA